MIDVPPQEAQFDEFGRPLHPIAAAIHNASMGNMGSGFAGQQGPVIPPTPQPVANPTQQVSPQSIMPSPVQQPNKPDYSPLQIQPQVPTAAQWQKDNSPPPDPSDPQFKNSRLRTVLNSIAAGLTGAADPRAGMQLAGELKTAKYDKAKKSYDVKMGKLDETIAGETGREKQATNLAEAGVRRGVAMAGTEVKEETEETRRKNAETTAKREQDYKANVDSLDQARQAMEDKNKELTKQLQQKQEEEQKRIEDFNNVLNEKDPVKQQELLKNHQQLFNKPITPTASNDPKMAADIQDAKTNAAAANPNTPKVAAITSEARATATQKAITNETEHRANSPEYMAAKTSLDRAKSDSQLTANQKQTIGYAKDVLDIFPSIEAELDQAEKDGKLQGIVSTRWNDFKTHKWGDNDDPNIVKLSTDMDFLQGKTAQIHTTRTSNEVLRKFEKSFNSNVMDTRTLKASLQAVKKWMLEYSKDPRNADDPNKKITPGGNTIIR
jgi:hypothetical protein